MLSQKEKLIKDGWVETTLGEVVTFSQGFQVSTDYQYPEQKEGFVRFVRIVDYTNEGEKPRYIENPERCYVNENDLVMIRYGSQTAGKIVRGIAGVIANNTFQIKPIENIDKNWLYWFLRQDSIYQFLNKDQSSSTMPAITFTQVGKLEILLPPLPEQLAIAAVLSSFDDKIELLREENKTLEEIGQTIFKEWFGKYSVERPEELPEGWRVGKLGEENFAEIIRSGVNKFDGEKIYLATADVSDLNIINTSEKITFQERPSRANMQPIEKSIWFAKMQDSRKLLMFDDYSEFEIENFILSTGFAGIKTIEISHYFIWCFILSKDFDELKNNMANGAVQVAVNNTNLEKIEILIPKDETLAKFNELAKPIFKKIYDNNSQIQSLARSRDELLPKLMSGEVRVK